MENVMSSERLEIKNDKRFVNRKFDLTYDVETAMSKEKHGTEDKIQVRNRI